MDDAARESKRAMSWGYVRSAWNSKKCWDALSRLPRERIFVSLFDLMSIWDLSLIRQIGWTGCWYGWTP
jgi:hypothetical protein